MPFDPTIPQELTQADAAQIRGQFNALKALIDVIQSIQSVQFTSITTLPPGSPATGSIQFSGGVLQIALSLPQGNDGIQGPEGQQGIQGPPGEVTVSELNAAMAAVLAQTSNNTNNVSLLGMTADSSYQQWQMQSLSDKVDEMINAQRR